MQYKMNILTVIPWFPSPSSGYCLEGNFQYHQSKKLVERGNNVIILSIQKKGMPKYEIVDGICVYRFPAYTVPMIRYFVPQLTKLNRLIEDTCKDYNVDLLEFFSSDFLTSIPIIYVKNKIKLPTVVVVNGLPGISWFTGNRIVDSVGYLYTHTIGKKIIQSADGVRLLHSGLYKDLQMLGVQRDNIKAISQGVNTDTFSPYFDKLAVRSALNIGERDFLVLYVGRLVNPIKMKGTPFLIEAIKDLLPENKNIKLLFVGDGNGRTKNEELTLDINSNVIFTGYRYDVNRVMSAADVLVVPSLAEGCPAVVLEASACGIPVIACRVGGVPDLIEDGKTGIIVNTENVFDIKQALLTLKDNPASKMEMGKRARQRMESEFTWDKICEKLEIFYSSLLNTPTVRSRDEVLPASSLKSSKSQGNEVEAP
jgi:glycosyltransferase involved in cell wall biosynthesis